MTQKYTIGSSQEMLDLGVRLSSIYPKILLYGDLGSGKTHFVKGFAKGLGINIDHVHSPTYVYFHEYHSDHPLLHIDMYRISELDVLIERGIYDQIHDYDYICIERPRFESEYIDSSRVQIHITKTGENTREVVLSDMSENM